MNQTDTRIELRDKTTVFQGYFRVDRYRLRHRKFDGGWTDEMSREIFERGHAASVLLYDPDRDAVVLIEQFRAGALAAGFEPWLIEIVAGIIEAGEEPSDVVRREAIEEAGCPVTDLEPIGTILLSPGGCSETLAMFCGRVDSTKAGGVHGLDHEHEDIRVFTVPFAQAMDELAAGKYLNAPIVMSLQWLALNRDALCKKWI
jgi:ADP-ribose pyrophosphatase